MPFPIKLDIFIKSGAHTTEHESKSCYSIKVDWFGLTLLFLVNKQINDKERIAAAMENPNLREIVETCIKEEDWCVWAQYVKL